MEKKNSFWILTLCVFMLFAVNAGLSLPLRIAIGANGVVILLEVIKQTKEILNGRKEKD